MCQIGSTREIICLRHWWGHPGDRRKTLLTHCVIYRKLCSTNTSDSSFKKIQTAQGPQDDSIDCLHQESCTLKVNDHSDMISAQYLVNCLEEDHVWHGITTQDLDPLRKLSTPDITQLLFLDSTQAGMKATKSYTHTR